MKRIFLAAAAATTVFAGATASAQEWNASIGGIVDEGFEELGVTGRVGYDFNATFGVEGELSYFSLDEGDLAVVGGADVDADAFSYIAFAKAQAPVGDRVTLFGRLGYGGVTVDVDVEGFGSDSESEDAFAYGVGAEFAVTPNGAVRADYTRIDLGSGFGDEGFFALAYTFRFGGTR